MYPIIIDSTPLFEIKLLNGQIFLDILIFDKYNHLVFQIKENQLLYSTKPWDIELIGKKLTIREGKGKILIEFDFHPPNKILINRGKFLLNGVEILIKPDGITLTNIMFTIGNISHKSQGGLAVGGSKLPFKCFSHVKQVPRYVDDINKLLKKN